MLAAKNFLSGMQTVRQIEFSLFDLILHHDFDPTGDKSGAAAAGRSAQRSRRRFPARLASLPEQFSHIFAGGYAAGYYSYKWAEVLSADCYAAFEEAGNPFDPRPGGASSTRSCPSAAYAPHSTRSRPSAVAIPVRTRCCGIVV